MQTRIFAAILGLSLSVAPACAMADGPAPASPAAQTFHLGALELTALRDASFTSPNDGGDFGSNAGPAAVGRLLTAAGASDQAISLSIDALLVRMPGHVVLLDTGVGPASHGALLASLRLAGVAPDQVTDVLITHGHFDHIGGLVYANNTLVFPKATVWISTREWRWLQDQPDFKTLVEAIAPQVRSFEPGRDILPGIRPVALYGHTPGHVGYEIVSDGHVLVDIGDAAHSSIVSLAKPGWWGWIDDNPKAAAATRRAELRRLAASHDLVFAPHFPFPGVGRIVAKGDGYAWAPGG